MKILYAQSKKYPLQSWLLILIGLVVVIYLGINSTYAKLSRSPIAFILIGIIILIVFFLIPIKHNITRKELSIHQGVLKIKSFPSQQEKIYDLKNLVFWEEAFASGRYQYGRNLYLTFIHQQSIQKKLSLSEMEYTDFEEIVTYFNTEFKRIKKKKKT